MSTIVRVEPHFARVEGFWPGGRAMADVKYTTALDDRRVHFHAPVPLTLAYHAEVQSLVCDETGTPTHVELHVHCQGGTVPYTGTVLFIR